MSTERTGKTGKKRYTIDEISDRTGFSKRTIRYYVQKQIIDPPSGRGRGGFYYDSHLSDLLRIRQLREQSLNLNSIREILKGRFHSQDKETGDFRRDLRVRYEIIPGLEINISRNLEERKNKKIIEAIRLIKSFF